MPNETNQPMPSEQRAEAPTSAKSKHDVVQERITALLTYAGLPQPDTIERTATCVRFLWTDRKVAVVVDLAEFDNQAEPQR